MLGDHQQHVQPGEKLGVVDAETARQAGRRIPGGDQHVMNELVHVTGRHSRNGGCLFDGEVHAGNGLVALERRLAPNTGGTLEITAHRSGQSGCTRRHRECGSEEWNPVVAVAPQGSCVRWIAEEQLICTMPGQDYRYPFGARPPAEMHFGRGIQLDDRFVDEVKETIDLFSKLFGAEFHLMMVQAKPSRSLRGQIGVAPRIRVGCGGGRAQAERVQPGVFPGSDCRNDGGIDATAEEEANGDI